MPEARSLDTQAELNAIADARRVAMLRMLMASPGTITQIGERLGKHPAWIRHHVQVLLRAGLVELVEERVVANYTEKYYGATARAFESHVLIAPLSSEPDTLVSLGSHDLGMEILGREVALAHVGLVSVPIGSLDGLIALRQGLCDMAGCHLFDHALGEYNTPFLRHLFPDLRVLAITLADREQGLIVADGNPLSLSGLDDLERTGVRFANRNPGSGTRVWVDEQARRDGLQTERIKGYETSFATHTGVAAAVAAGKADAGVGLRAAAEDAGLGFVPLFVERYDVVFREDSLGKPAVDALVSSLESRRLRRSLGALAGYDTSHTGEQAPSAA